MTLYQKILKLENLFMYKAKEIKFSEAIKQAIFQSMKKFPESYLMGEGVNDPSSMWGTIKGVSNKFGKNRVIEMPISENGLFGIAIGSAIHGSKPIINLQRVEFSLYAFEQIINNAAKTSYLSLGKHSVPLVIRMVIGRGWGQGPQHAQSLENIFSSIPGLKVVIPCFPNDAKKLLISSIADKNPVIFLEHRWLHNTKGLVESRFKIEKLKSIKKVLNGNQLTIIANSINIIECMKAINFLKKRIEVSIDLLNLQVTNPLEINEIKKSVRKTKKLLSLDLGFKNLGLSSEIISRLIEDNILFKLPPVRLGLPFYPTPSSRGLIKNYYPSSLRILMEIINLLKIKKNISLKIINEFKSDHINDKIDVPDDFFKGPF
jgi:acetoin:2,6-dichlorophenolindophenol oxidoreductase subunit beta